MTRNYHCKKRSQIVHNKTPANGGSYKSGLDRLSSDSIGSSPDSTSHEKTAIEQFSFQIGRGIARYVILRLTRIKYILSESEFWLLLVFVHCRII